MTFTPRTWVVGETVSAAIMNQEIRDQFNSMFAAWTSYTPTWGNENGSAPSLGNGTLDGAYLKIGRTVHFRFFLVFGSTTTPGGPNANWTFSLPASPVSTTWKLNGRVIHALVGKNGGNNYAGTGLLSTTSGGIVRSLRDSLNVNANIWDGDASSPLAVWAAADVLTVWGTYEAAS